MVTVVVVTYQNRDHIAGLPREPASTRCPTDGSSVVWCSTTPPTDGTAELVESTFPTVHVVRSERQPRLRPRLQPGGGQGHHRVHPVAQPGRGGGARMPRGPDRAGPPTPGRRASTAAGPSARTATWTPSRAWGDPRSGAWCASPPACPPPSPTAPSSTREGLGRWPRDTERQVDVVSGFLLLARRDVWDRLGGFDERFFMYGEDADLGVRVRALGYGSIISPEARIVHVGGGSSPALGKQVLLFRGQGHAGAQAVARTRPGRWRSTLLLAGVWLRATPRAVGPRSMWPGRRPGAPEPHRPRGPACGPVGTSGETAGRPRPTDPRSPRPPATRHGTVHA